MDRRYVAAVAYVLFGVYYAVRGASGLLAEGISLWPVLGVGVGVLTLAVFARSAARGDVLSEFELAAENEVYFWCLVAAAVFHAFLLVFEVVGFGLVRL